MIRTSVFCRIAAGLVFLLAVPVSFAQSAPDKAHIDEVLRGLNRGHGVGQVAVSPDGKYLASIQSNGGIVLENLGDHKSDSVAAGDGCRQNNLVWRPDSKALAFFATCGQSKQGDFYLWSLDGGKAVRLTALNGYVNEPAFSPDGTKIAFLYVEGATRPAGALAAMKPFAGVIGEDGIEVV